MCGIFGYIGNKKNAAEIVFDGLKSLEYRGYDSWGIATVSSKPDSEKIIVLKKAGMIGDASIADLPQSGFALGHTRWATHGGVNDINAHPHLDCTKQLAIIHNGIIENYDEIKKELMLKGHKFASETDTEVAIHLIEENLKKLKEQRTKNKEQKEIFVEAVRQSFNRFIGLNAIVVMDAERRCFVAAKNGSPLVIGRGLNENYLASDAHALLAYTRDVYFMDDDEVILLTDKKIDVVEAEKCKKIKIRFTHLNWSKNIASKGEFPHFMLKEIYDQPQVLKQIVSDNETQISDISKQIKNSYGTYLVGCGTASYACLAGTYIFSKIAKRHVNFSVGSEFGYLVDFLTPKSLVIALSQSGETIDVIEAIKKAKLKGARIATMVNVLGSTLYRMSDFKLLLVAGIEQAVVSTKAFTAKLAHLILIAYQLIDEYYQGRQVIHQAIQSLEEILKDSYINKIKHLISLINKNEHIYVIGRGLSYPIALETALKIKEASYIHSEGFAAGELKHGVIALVEKGTPCIAFLPNDETYGANLAGAMEVKARGGFIIGISYKPHEVFDYYFPISDCGVASIIPSVVAGQLLGYYLAVSRGLNPDKPRNLAKSVTVK